jgi:transglutaminase-like putative cysteine protease
MRHLLSLTTACGLTILLAQADAPKRPAPKSREFFFTYTAAVTGLEPGKVARLWLPVAATNADQEVTIHKQDLPAAGKMMKEPKYGNQILYVEAQAGADGTIPLAVTYRVKRYEVRADARAKPVSREEMDLFLKPDAKVPIGGKPATLLEGRQLPRDEVELGRVLYDVVNHHMVYAKDKPGWGEGDAVWACDSKFGNCSDFHSLFISLARTQKIPAKFEIGFQLPEQRGAGAVAGYHCWAKFKPEGKGWIPVDISEANKFPPLRDYYFGNLTADRVTFSVGRDLTLVPPQDGPPLNFFIHPHVEVDAKPYPAEKVRRQFTYQDSEAQRE